MNHQLILKDTNNYLIPNIFENRLDPSKKRTKVEKILQRLPCPENVPKPLDPPRNLKKKITQGDIEREPKWRTRREVEDRVKLAIEARARLMTRQSSLAKRSDSFVRLSARLIPEDRRKEGSRDGSYWTSFKEAASCSLEMAQKGEKDGRVELIPQLSFLRSFVTPVTDRLEM